MTHVRITSSIIFFAVFLLGLFHESFFWIPPLIILPAALLGVWEFSNLGSDRPPKLQLLLAFAGAAALLADGYFFSLRHGVMILGLLTVLTVLAGLPVKTGDIAAIAGKSVVAPIYVALPLALIVQLWRDNLNANAEWPHAGAHYVLFLILVTWASDTGAYFVGRRWGKTKIIPRLSPGKTLEGYIGGFVFTILVAVILRGAWNNIAELFSWWDVLALGFIFSIVSPLGDLAESQLKRSASTKDSGETFTGMGGMLDIIDSLLCTTVFYYIYLAALHPEAFPKGLALISTSVIP